ncbi:MAG: hypothetical protein WBC44_15185 [Planctomycetaceae bacterium]
MPRTADVKAGPPAAVATPPPPPPQYRYVPCPGIYRLVTVDSDGAVYECRECGYTTTTVDLGYHPIDDHSVRVRVPATKGGAANG